VSFDTEGFIYVSTPVHRAQIVYTVHRPRDVQESSRSAAYQYSDINDIQGCGEVDDADWNRHVVMKVLNKGVDVAARASTLSSGCTPHGSHSVGNMLRHCPERYRYCARHRHCHAPSALCITLTG